jgi:hypothetical protein
MVMPPANGIAKQTHHRNLTCFREDEIRLPEFRRNGAPQPGRTAAHATLVWLSHQFGRHGVGVQVCLGAWMQLCKQYLHQNQNVKLKQIGMHKNGQMVVWLSLLRYKMSPCT